MGLQWYGHSKTGPGTAFQIGDVTVFIEFGRKLGIHASDDVEIKRLDGKEAREIRARCERRKAKR